MPKQGKCVIVSAPSGAGKTTLVKHVLASGLNLEFSVSACSRPMRQGETHGKDYYFLTVNEFRQKIEEQAFIEWEEVYPGSFYGTLKSEIERIWAEGKHVIFDVDVYGGIQLKKIFGDTALAVFIAPPSLEVLKERLTIRSSDSEESIRERLEQAREELSLQNQFDFILINDQLSHAQNQLYQKISSFLT